MCLRPQKWDAVTFFYEKWHTKKQYFCKCNGMAGSREHSCWLKVSSPACMSPVFHTCWNQAEDGPSTRKAAIRAYRYLHAVYAQRWSIRSHRPIISWIKVRLWCEGGEAVAKCSLLCVAAILDPVLDIMRRHARPASSCCSHMCVQKEEKSLFIPQRLTMPTNFQQGCEREWWWWCWWWWFWYLFETL